MNKMDRFFRKVFNNGLYTMLFVIVFLALCFGLTVGAATVVGTRASVNIPGTVNQTNGVTVYIVNVDGKQFAVASGPNGVGICQVWDEQGFRPMIQYAK